MDTNQFYQLFKDLIAREQSVPISNNSIVVTSMVIGAFLNSLGLVLTYLKAASAKDDTEKARETLKDIHVAVNSKETLAARKLDELQEKVVNLTQRLATSDQQVKSAEADAKEKL